MSRSSTENKSDLTSLLVLVRYDYFFRRWLPEE